MTDGAADCLQAQVVALTAALHAMRERLAAEREALRNRADAGALEALARDKRAVVEQVATLYDGLRAGLSAFDDGDGDAGRSIAAVRQTHPALAAHVDTMVSLIRECQQANQDNGILVNAGLRSANGALDALQGTPPPTPADTYDTQGRTRRGSAADLLALRA